MQITKDHSIFQLDCLRRLSKVSFHFKNKKKKIDEEESGKEDDQFIDIEIK
jgi:hypothetical protein